MDRLTTKAESKLVYCGACFEHFHFTISGSQAGLYCEAGAHFFCKECFQAYVMGQIESDPYSRQRFATQGAKIVCPSCPRLAAPFRDAEIQGQVNEATWATYRAVATQIKAARQFEERLQKKLQRTQSTVEKHRAFIADQILTNRCPSCKTAFFDWSGYVQ